MTMFIPMTTSTLTTMFIPMIMNTLMTMFIPMTTSTLTTMFIPTITIILMVMAITIMREWGRSVTFYPTWIFPSRCVRMRNRYMN